MYRHRCVVREDGKGEVVIAGLEEKEAVDEETLEALIADGNRNRTTHATESNDQSSRYRSSRELLYSIISTCLFFGGFPVHYRFLLTFGVRWTSRCVLHQCELEFESC